MFCSPQSKSLSHLFLMPLALFMVLLSPTGRGPATTAKPLHAAPAELLVVDRTDDAGGLACTGAPDDCTLRSALVEALDPGEDFITFDSDQGEMTITLSSPLPELGDEATTIAPLDADQVVEIDANNVGGNIFDITASDVRIEGLRLYGSGDGWANIWIHASAQGVVIANNLIGDDGPAAGGCGQSPVSHSGIYISSTGSTPSGARAWVYGNTIECLEGDPGTGIVITGSGADGVVVGANDAGQATVDQRNVIRHTGGDGVLIQNGAANATVRNTRLLGNAGYGIRLANGDQNEIFGNTVAANGTGGMMLESDSDANRIGCPLLDPVPAVERNVIRDNAGDGITLTGAGTATNFILCNWIGVGDDGTSAAANGLQGVLITGEAHNNSVGATFATGNVISGNGRSGVFVSGADDNVVLGNYIGLNAAGDAAVPNGDDGVSLVGASDNVIGSATEDNAGNVISGNGQDGVFLATSGTTGNTIDGNLIGLDAAGTNAVPNGSAGVEIIGADGTAIGPSASDTEQLIHHNQGAGIRIHNTDGALVGTSNTVQYNGEAGIVVTGDSAGVNVHAQAVYGNGGLPIDLGDDGHTPNDAGDGDSGPNTLLNHPVITGSSGDTIMGTACACTIHVYEALGDPSAPGGGGVLIGSEVADGSGNWSATLPAGLTRYDVTVMAVDTALNSSEMAPRPHVVLPLILSP